MDPLTGFAAQDPDLPGGTGDELSIGWATWIIPMDNKNQKVQSGDLQGAFNMRAYGLVNRLLWAGIPIMWAIHPDKTKEISPSGEPIDLPDFRAKVLQVKPVMGVADEVLDFLGGPFLIPIKHVKKAEQIIDGFNADDPDAPVTVYELRETTKIWIRYELTHKPKVAVLNPFELLDPFQKILDRTGGFTAGAQYDVINPALAQALPANGCYTAVVAPHTNSGQVTPGMLNTVRNFVQNGGNLVAQCQAVDTYENHFVTTGTSQTMTGIDVANAPHPLAYPSAALAFSQFVGPLNGARSGTFQDWTVRAGIPGGFVNNTHVHAQSSTDSKLLTAAVSKLTPGAVGTLTFYLGGHDYSGSPDPGDINGLRMLLNAIMVPATPQNCPAP
jgi:hypothetical protein